MNPKITATEIANYLGVTVQAVHHKIKLLNLPVKKSLNKIYFGHNIGREIIKKSGV
jgi:chromosome partitioning protein